MIPPLAMAVDPSKTQGFFRGLDQVYAFRAAFLMV
jgi:hypothetical protein